MPASAVRKGEETTWRHRYPSFKIIGVCTDYSSI
jgi:hypothetical protein